MNSLGRPTRLLALLALGAPLAVVLGTSGAPAGAATTDVRINEVVTTGAVNDSIELTNKGTSTIDVSGWILKDNDNSSKYTIASGTTIAAGAFKAFDVSGKFGLGSSDQARLYLGDGTTLIDSFTWTAHSNTSWSRCPDGTGSFVQSTLSLGGPNVCTSGTATTWPGGSTVANADASKAFGTDMSGLVQEGSVMWAAQNSGKLWRLVRDGSGGWKADTTNGWTSGKTLKFPTGSGNPDDEGVTITSAGSSAGVYVASERNSSSSGTSRLSVLRYDVSGTATTLTATKEWNLTSDLPAVDSNSGLEAVTFVPDSALTSAGFRDASTGTTYNPATYASHGGGVFFVGVEATGTIYGYVLTDAGAVTRVATIGSGMAGVMDLQWEPSTSRMWAVCDDICSGQHRTLQVNTSGYFAVTAVYNRPSGMPNYNNEGFALAGSDECVGGTKPVYWSDDSNDSSHALRRGTVTC